MSEDKKQTFTLAQLAERNGHTAKTTHPEDVPFDWQHRVADQVHGWSNHNYHYQADPVMLTDEQYIKALECSSKDHSLHKPAVAVPPSRAQLDARIDEQTKALDKVRKEAKQAAEAAQKQDEDAAKAASKEPVK